MRHGRALILGTAGTLIFAATCAASGPVAVVEDIAGKPAGVEFMDYVEAGKVIKLGPRDKIVLGYLKSCWRETITGGTVTVGPEQSKVELGSVARTQVKCDGGRIDLSPEQAVQSAGTISRSLSEQASVDAKLSVPQVTLFARIPMLDVRAGGTLVIERLDKPGEKLEIVPRPADLVRGAFLDLIRANRVLTAGGIYRATLGGKQIVFRIDPQAPPTGPVASRLLRF